MQLLSSNLITYDAVSFCKLILASLGETSSPDPSPLMPIARMRLFARTLLEAAVTHSVASADHASFTYALQLDGRLPHQVFSFRDLRGHAQAL